MSDPRPKKYTAAVVQATGQTYCNAGKHYVANEKIARSKPRPLCKRCLDESIARRAKAATK